MALPIFEEFLYPFLLATSKKDMTISEMRQYIVDYFHLSEEDCSLRTKSGNTTQVADRLNWVRQYLRRALMIDLPERGIYRITQRGKDYLANHSWALWMSKRHQRACLSLHVFSQREPLSLSTKQRVRLFLIDGKALAKYMIEYNVRVSTKKVYAIKKIDADYFEE
jgi:restriction endonuclease Mrr